MSSNIKRNQPLKHLTAFSIGGNARYFIEVDKKSELKEAIEFAKEKELEIFILGGGSNILVADEGYSGLVIKLKNGKAQEVEETEKIVVVRVDAGKNWDEFVEEMVEKSRQGIECLSGIPGTVGAAPIQNIGAYGQELDETFLELTAFDTKDNRFLKFNKKSCDFGYRDSFFKNVENKRRYVVFDVTFKLNKSDKPTLTYESLTQYLNENRVEKPTLVEVRKAVLDIRSSKLEDYSVKHNAGSFFKNPIISEDRLKEMQIAYSEIPNYPNGDGSIKIPAGWLIEKSGWKGKVYKNVAVSDKHALVLTNPEGKGTASEIVELANMISKDVSKKFGLELEPEVQFVGLI